MATFVLDGKASAELPRRPIAVSLTVAGPAGGARLLAEGRGGRQVRVVQHTGSLLILPRVDEETTVSAVPDGRDRFGQGTVLHVTLGPDDPSDLGADVIQLTPRDVSGLSFIELATLVPVDAGTVGVTTKLAVPDAPLPPVAAHARVACRGVLHRDQVDEADRVRVGCVVDTSVSMAPLFASGTVAAAGDIVAGLAAVLSGGEDVELAAPGPSGADRAAYSASELGDHLRQSPVAGFGYAVDLNPAVGPHDRVVGGVAVGPSLTVVITDGRGVVEFAEGVVALVLSHSASVSSGPGFAGAVCPLPPPGVGGRDFLAGQPQLVSRVVADLLAASGRAGAGLAGGRPMTKCPRCFHDLPDDEFAWYDSADTRVELNQVASRYAGGDVHTRSVHTVLRPPDADHTWSPVPEDVAHHVEVCPLCHYDLPGNWRWGDATCIAMAGARYTGKTVYIAVLIKQLKKFLEAADTEVTPADMVTERTYAANYERPLFEQRGIAAATPAAAVAAHQPPLIFNIGFWGERQHFLVIRDVAGEDLENAETSGPSWEFFGLAHAVLFLFDPLRVRDISDQLLDLVPPTNLIGGDPGDVLRKVMSLIGRGNPRIGLVLSKFDALQALSRVEQSSWGRVMANPGAAFNRDPGLVAAEYDEDDGTLLHCEVVSLLQRLHAGPMLRTLRNPVTGQYYENRFFAVSALGMPPVGEKLHRSGISPFRCLDPIRWVLAERGVSQT